MKLPTKSEVKSILQKSCDILNELDGVTARPGFDADYALLVLSREPAVHWTPAKWLPL